MTYMEGEVTHSYDFYHLSPSDKIKTCGYVLTSLCHDAGQEAGKWRGANGHSLLADHFIIPAKLMAIAADLAHAYSADLSTAKDADLPHRKEFEVKLAELIINVFDLAGAKHMDLGSAIAEKMVFDEKAKVKPARNRRSTNGNKP